MTAQPNYPTDKLVIKYLFCGGAVGGLIMGALAMHNELRFADNLRGFAHVLWVGAVCGLLQDILCITTAPEIRLRCNKPRRWRC